MLVTNKLDEYFDVLDIPNNIAEDIQLIRNWVKAHPHLPHISDRQISIFLHCCNGISTTKTTIDNFYTIRTLAPEIFSGRFPKVFEERYKIVHVFKLPELSEDDSRLFFGGLSCFEPEKLDVADAVGLFFSLVDIYSNLEPYAPGWRIVLDAKGFTFGHFVKLTSSLAAIKKTICYVQDALQIRLKGIHVINASPLIAQFVGVIKPLLKKHLYDLIQLYTPAEAQLFHKIVPADRLPIEAGGKCATINELVQSSLDDLQKYEKWFEDDEKEARIDQEKRRESVSSGPLVVEGFRKLSID